ncbi:MAG: transcriptional repressor LexA [Planctomycetes bacterium]|nr:transcriptional repressor LexA [Planctomycetota bacterium]
MTTRKKSLTKRQKEVLAFIGDYLRTRGISPTLKEIAEHLGVSKITVHEHVKALVAKNYLAKEPHISRSLVPTDHRDSPEPSFTIPVLGTIAAGFPIEAVSDEQPLDLAAWFPPQRRHFILRVKGYSMIDDHIQDGDYVVIEPQREPRDGDPVVALIDGNQATLKRFYREPNRIRLQPSNSELRPIYSRNVDVQGVVVGVLRRL